MSTQTPTIGRIVHYTLSTMDADLINKRRKDATAHMGEHRDAATGVMVHVGNEVHVGDVFPMLITHVWSEAASLVNGTVLLDGNDTYWATSRRVGEGPGFYAWPGRS